MADNLEQKLNEIMNVGRPFLMFDNFANSFKSDVANSKLIEEYVKQSNPGLDEAWIKRMADDVKKCAPAIVLDMMNATAKEFEGGLIEKVSENYTSIAKSFGSKYDEYLINMALTVSGKDKEYAEIKKNIKENNFAAVRKKYAATFKSKAWKIFIEKGASEEFIASFAPRYYEFEKERFVKEYNDPQKLSNYLLNRIDQVKDDKDKNKIYLEAGRGLVQYHEQLIKRAQEAAKKKAA